MDIFTHREIGSRPENQDLVLVKNTEENFIMAVADGHGTGGLRVAHMVMEVVDRYSAEDINQAKSIKIFNQARHETRRMKTSGSTLSMVTKCGDEFHILQCGDSPIFIKQNGKVEAFWGHNANYIDNRPDLQRAVKAGGTLVDIRGKLYVGMGKKCLALTRSFGDNTFGDIICHEPFYTVRHAPVEAVLVASDGLTLSSSRVESLMNENASIEEFVRQQYQFGVRDNLTLALTYL